MPTLRSPAFATPSRFATTQNNHLSHHTTPHHTTPQHRQETCILLIETRTSFCKNIIQQLQRPNALIPKIRLCQGAKKEVGNTLAPLSFAFAGQTLAIFPARRSRSRSGMMKFGRSSSSHSNSLIFSIRVILTTISTNLNQSQLQSHFVTHFPKEDPTISDGFRRCHVKLRRRSTLEPCFETGHLVSWTQIISFRGRSEQLSPRCFTHCDAMCSDFRGDIVHSPLQKQER